MIEGMIRKTDAADMILDIRLALSAEKHDPYMLANLVEDVIDCKLKELSGE